MFEYVGRLRWKTSLIEQLRLDQPPQLPLQGGGVQLRDRLEQIIRKATTNNRCILGDGFGSHQTIESRHKRVLASGWNGERGKRPCELVVPIDRVELS